MTTKELIRQEIERLKSKYRHNGLWTSSFQTDLAMAKIESMNELLTFLDTLEEPVSDDLEEAAETKYPTRWKKYPNDGIVRSEEYFDLNAEKRDAFKAGAEWMKRKMMERTVEGEVCILPGNGAYVKEKNNESLKQYLLDNFKTGDEVSIIILPKEVER